MVVAVAVTPTWYVTCEVGSYGILPKPRSPRVTRTFLSEAEAKNFARSKFAGGLVVFAGTINPHTPKRVIPSAIIQAWLLDGGKDPSSGDNQ